MELQMEKSELTGADVGTAADPKTVGDKCPNDGMMPVCCYTIVSFFSLPLAMCLGVRVLGGDGRGG
jgi:hypothetical protein